MFDSFSHISLGTWLIIAVTCVVSFRGFRTFGFEEKYIFNPEAILAGGQYYRLVTPGFLHADMRHLMLNMFTLFFFGRGVEANLGSGQFLLIYFSAIVGGNLLSLYVHRHHDYRAYGASGGVCGMIFASILLNPGGAISLMYLPIWIPNWLYAIGFLLASFYGMKEHNRGGIGHDAHLGGAILGFALTAVLHPEYVGYNLRVFGIVLITSIALLIYLWLNPLFLPTSAFSGGLPWGKRGKRTAVPSHKGESLQLDAVLDKVARSGIESLTREEKALLEHISGKYRRREQSKKPKSGLAI
jgi:membrane associated rhomboid family serine protease